MVSERGGKATAFVTLALALLLTACTKEHADRPKQREVALRDDLFQMRKAIDAFNAAERRAPSSLNELVPKYLRSIPHDPITGKADWRVITEETVAVSSDFTTAQTPKPTVSVIDVRSKAAGADSTGKPYSEY